MEKGVSNILGSELANSIFWWSKEQDRWVNEICKEVRATVLSIRAKIQVFKEKHQDLDMFVNNLMQKNEAERHVHNEEGDLDHIIPQFDDDNDVFFDCLAPAQEYAKTIGGAEYFSQDIRDVIQSGKINLIVYMSIYPDIMIPPTEVATIDTTFFTTFPDLVQRLVSYQRLMIEIALSIDRYAQVARGGDRFANEITKRVLHEIVEDKSISVAIIIPKQTSEVTSRLFPRTFGVEISFDPFTSSIPQYPLQGPRIFRNLPAPNRFDEFQ